MFVSHVITLVTTVYLFAPTFFPIVDYSRFILPCLVQLCNFLGLGNDLNLSLTTYSHRLLHPRVLRSIANIPTISVALQLDAQLITYTDKLCLTWQKVSLN